MNKQEVFDKVYVWLMRDNGERCFSESKNECLYRGIDSNGKPNMCAIGIFIPDGKYSESMEGGRDRAFIASGLLSEGFGMGIPDPNFMFLFDLQSVHDNVRSWESKEIMHERLHEVSDRYDLVCPAMEQQ